MKTKKFTNEDVLLKDFGDELFPGILSGAYLNYLNSVVLKTDDRSPLLIRLAEKLHIPFPEFHAYLFNKEASSESTDTVIRDKYIYTELQKLFTEFIISDIWDHLFTYLNDDERDEINKKIEELSEKRFVDNFLILPFKTGISTLHKFAIKYLSAFDSYIVYDATPLPLCSPMNDHDFGPKLELIPITNGRDYNNCQWRYVPFENLEYRRLVQLGVLTHITDGRIMFKPFNPISEEYIVMKNPLIIVEDSVVFNGLKIKKNEDLSFTTIAAFLCAFPDKCFRSLSDYNHRRSMLDNLSSIVDKHDKDNKKDWLYLINDLFRKCSLYASEFGDITFKYNINYDYLMKDHTIDIAYIRTMAPTKYGNYNPYELICSENSLMKEYVKTVKEYTGIQLDDNGNYPVDWQLELRSLK